MRIVVFTPNLIGDTVMATPTLRALRRGFPGAEIAAVLKPFVVPTLDGSTAIDRVIPYQAKSPDPDRQTWGVIRQLRRERFDLAVLLPNSIRSALMARLAGIPRRVGYARGGRGWLLTDRLLPPRDDRGRFRPTPIVAYYLELARHLGCPVDTRRTELFTTIDDETAADRAWERLEIDHDRPLVTLNTGGAFGPAKNWPNESFATLARRLAQEIGASILVVCGPSERESARKIAELADHRHVRSLADEPLSIGLTKACVRRSSLMITTDSGPRHFAGGFGVPVVTLFGPTHIEWTRTNLPNAVNLRVPVPCGPCQQGICPTGDHRCMVEMTPEAVFRAAVRLLDFRTRTAPHSEVRR